MVLIGRRMYSGRFMGVPIRFFMSMVMKIAPGVDMTELNMIFDV